MFQVDKLLSSIGILLFMIIHISVCIVIVWVSFLNIEFDCKSNNLNCGKFRTENLFSPPLPDYFQVHYTDSANEDIGNAYKRSTALRVYVTLDLYTRQAVRPAGFGV